MVVSLIPQPMFVFAVKMGINYGKGKKEKHADEENDNHWIMSPYPSQKG
jgi:hypothetical protein